MEPYFGDSAQSWLAEYILPFKSDYDTSLDNGYDGIIFINFSLEGLRRIVSTLKLGKTGFSFIITNQGNIVSYPSSGVMGKNIHNLTGSHQLLSIISKHMDTNKLIKFKHPIHGRECWLTLERIAGTNAILGAVILADELRDYSFSQDKVEKLILFFLLVFLVTLFALIVRQNSLIHYWVQLSTVIAIFLFGYLIYLWYSELTQHIATEHDSIQVVDTEGLNTILRNRKLITQQKNRRSLKLNAFSNKDVRVGIYIQAMQFLDANNIEVTGKIWQQSDITQIKETPDFIIANAQTITWKKIHEYQGYSLWYFNATLRQPFSHTTFPFDTENVRIKFLPKLHQKSLRLIPDFTGYSELSPDTLPGVSHDLIVNGWQLTKSYFSYREPEPQVTLGRPEQLSILDEPQLQFNLQVQREITGPIITHIFPILVVSLLIFCILMLWSKCEQQVSLWGFSTSMVLEYCAALFFILVISHVSLREALQAKGMIYLEFFYFITYVMIIITATCAVLYTSVISIHFLDYQESFIPKLIYWPSFFGSCVLVTLIQFW
ncbi:hypothetical protein H0A36_03850 [Endozoicomonas sp. SM1973]|uniref:Cache domain-containing protein n=2 Tax=Spartinivicinus marinus TaxID=2994442 RepID=A0A853HXP0_9GAMM|nr:hypothetical protein [Spartinivicinus marinus]